MLCQGMSNVLSLKVPAGVPWKEPVQARGKARVAAILDAARELIADHGLDIAMSAVSEKAVVPIGSVYQFFPDRSALLACLFAREMEAIDASLRNQLSRAGPPANLAKIVSQLMRRHLELVRERPVLLAIWSAPALDPALQAADLRNSQANALQMASAITERSNAKNRQAIEDSCLIICHLWGSMIRLAVLAESPARGDALLDQYSAMVAEHLEMLVS